MRLTEAENSRAYQSADERDIESRVAWYLTRARRISLEVYQGHPLSSWMPANFEEPHRSRGGVCFGAHRSHEERSANSRPRRRESGNERAELHAVSLCTHGHKSGPQRAQQRECERQRAW